MSEREESLRRAAEAHGQAHVFRHWDALGESAREALLDQLARLDWAQIDALRERVGRPTDADAAPRLEPPELFPLERDARERAHAEAAQRRGEDLLRAGRIGYVLVAGGQASRLGYDGPKGAFPVGPLSGRTLFELHARRLRAAGRRFAAPTPWYVMTSPQNDAATRSFFAAHRYFGLPIEDVFFFSQDVLPALDEDGRILLAAPGELFLAPNGHGGVLLALARSGALADMRARGVATLSYFQVDNPLARPADPTFLGLHALEDARMSSKVVAKRGPGEKVGVIGRIDGRVGCIEYSDLPEPLREARDERGQLVFRAGNIAVHALEVDFVEQLTREGLDLPWHVARKKVTVVDGDGGRTERWGLKFESFVFDALGRSPRSVTMEVARAEEFSPVKNREGEDSPLTARQDLCRLHAAWVERAGRALPPPDAAGLVTVEIDPLVAEDAHEFARAAATPREDAGGHLYEAAG